MERVSCITWGLLGVASLGVCLMAARGASGQKSVRQSSGGWRLAEPVTYENLTIFPVVSPEAAETSGFMTLEEGLASGEVVVAEQGGDILRRTRDAAPMGLVLLAGELVSGGKQDRIVAKDRIVAPRADPLPLDVFCVEHGRWSAGSKFTSAKPIVHPSVRERAAVDQKQTDVWAAVRGGTTSTASGGVAAAPPRISSHALDAAVATEARTESYAKLYQSSAVGVPIETFTEEVERRFNRAVAKLNKGEHVVGVVVAYGAEVAWSDVFASPAMFERYRSKLLRSYVVEALARPQTKESASADDAREFLRPLEGRESVESEPGVYRWRQVIQGHYAEIELQALRPVNLTLHWLKIHRTS